MGRGGVAEVVGRLSSSLMTEDRIPPEPCVGVPSFNQSHRQPLSGCVSQKYHKSTTKYYHSKFINPKNRTLKKFTKNLSNKNTTVPPPWGFFKKKKKKKKKK